MDYKKGWLAIGPICLHIGLIPRWNPWRMRQAGRWRRAVRKLRGPRSVGTKAAISGPCIPGMISTGYRLSAHAPGGSTNAVYRWRFDDGRTAEGKQVTKLFLRSGMRKVQLEVLDAPGGKVIARAAGEINVQINLAFMADLGVKRDRRSGSDLAAMIWEFGEEDTLAQLPLDDLVNLYEWSYPLEHWGGSSKVHDRGTWREWRASAQALKKEKIKNSRRD